MMTTRLAGPWRTELWEYVLSWISEFVSNFHGVGMVGLQATIR
jgi:hypothetical protein